MVGDKIKELPEVEALADAAWREKVPALRSITLRPQQPGVRADPLEAAAMQGVEATLPERIVWRWLETEGHLYETQLAEFGGRLVVGGAVVDFIVYDLAGVPVVLRVQGDYWHGPEFADVRARDDEQAGRLRRMGYMVVDLWESDIYAAVLGDRLTSFIEGEVGR